MTFDYSKPSILKEKLGNNIFSYETRQNKSLYIPALKQGNLQDVQVWNQVTFADTEDGVLRECTWLENFIRLSHPRIEKTLPPTPLQSLAGSPLRSDFEGGRPNQPTCPPVHQLIRQPTNPPITIFDNHNHALYFWLEAVRIWAIRPGFELVHIDEHSDLWSNEYFLDLDKAIDNSSYAWEFANHFCNVGNYIQPAIQSGLIKKILRIENEVQMDQYADYSSDHEIVLNLDLDIFAPEMDFIPEHKKLRTIRHFLKQARVVTIATSPFFIDQELAIEKLQRLFSTEE